MRFQLRHAMVKTIYTGKNRPFGTIKRIAAGGNSSLNADNVQHVRD